MSKAMIRDAILFQAFTMPEPITRRLRHGHTEGIVSVVVAVKTFV